MEVRAAIVEYLKGVNNLGVRPIPVSVVVQALEVDGTHKIEFVNQFFSGIHLEPGEVYEMPVVLRITGVGK